MIMKLDTNLEQNRFNMVEQQIRTWNVLDLTILNLLYKVRREEYVPAAYRSLAFADMEIPLDHGAVMLTPKMEARILQELRIKKTDKILEVGSGSGYMTALLAELGAQVYSVEIVPTLCSIAKMNLQTHGITNVTLEQGDAAQGWPQHGPYDVIVLTASTPILPEAFQKSLNPGGRLFAIVGEEPLMEAMLITCVAPNVYETKMLFETCTAPLRNALQPQRFTF
ncbi:protein-L-isoaspartate(D-aspartate) O-methyltransferase [Nitrosomonas communis]|uniref:Protein-L-isoaspartate O-methyltransferase n=2 Tax=Nitrosomonas communis TaxID=44574 RepID=A0A1H2RCE6_9PROT|nr:protein-L-isoaspartate(D-aspartate) O-methyltransferase [Nitrosomonas communis]